MDLGWFGDGFGMGLGMVWGWVGDFGMVWDCSGQMLSPENQTIYEIVWEYLSCNMVLELIVLSLFPDKKTKNEL